MPEVRTSVKNVHKWNGKNHTHLEKNRAQRSTRSDVQKHTRQNRERKMIMTPNSIPKSEFIFGVAPRGEPLEAQPTLRHKEWAHRTPKGFPMIGKQMKMISKNPKIAKHNFKSQAFSEPGLLICAKRLQYRH